MLPVGAELRPVGAGLRPVGAGLVFVLALAARLAVVAWAASRIPPTADGTFYHTIAGRIARGLGYTWLWPDGAVTNAGHYPIGYPALVGAAYALAGPHPAAAMLVNALLGSLAAVAAYRLVERAGGRRAALAAGVLVALHPALLAYTPALMTEGVTASLVACAAWAASATAQAARPGRTWWWVVLTGVIVGAATLVRPQSLVLAPVFGWLAAGARSSRSRSRLFRVGSAAVALAAALAVCAPWTARNCLQMKRCALVSHNGGWNLLIGTNEKGNGSWAELVAPPECREVFDEAEKDVCFGAAARRVIAEKPGPWLALAPKKLAATFDYAGAGGWYLHAANGAAFPERAKVALGAVETVFERVVLVAALLVSVRAPLAAVRARRRTGRPAPRIRARDLVALGLALAGVLSAFLLHAWVGYVALGVLLLAVTPAEPVAPAEPVEPVAEPAVASPDGVPDRTVLFGATAAVLLSLAGTHAVFFGAGRYSLVAFPFVTAVAAVVFARRSS